MKGKKLFACLLAIVIALSFMPTALAASDLDPAKSMQIQKSSAEMLAEESLHEGLLQVNEQVIGTDTENAFKVQIDVMTAEDLSQMVLPGDAAVFIMVDKSSSIEKYSPIVLDREALDELCSTHPQLGAAKENLPKWLAADAYEAGEDKLIAVDEAIAEFTEDSGFEDLKQAVYNCYHRRAWFERKAVMDFLDEYTAGIHADSGVKRYFAMGSMYLQSSLKVDWTLVKEGWESDGDVAANVTDYGPETKESEQWNSETRDNQLSNGKNVYTNGSGSNIESAYIMAENMFTYRGEITDIPPENCHFILITDGEPTYYVTDEQFEKSKIVFQDPTSKRQVEGTSMSDNVYSEASLNRIKDCVANEKYKTLVAWYGSATLDNSIYLKNPEDYCEDFDGADDNDLSDLGLSGVFEEKIKEIKTVTYPWTVKSPAADFITYKDAIFTDHTPKAAVTISPNALEWDLTQSTPIDTTGDDGTTKLHHYQLVYNIALDNTLAGFEKEHAYPINESTTLDYTISKATNSEITSREKGSVLLEIPQIEGYLSDVAFKKIANNGSALSGAMFALTGNAMSLSETSQNGGVTFASVPSGATYTLKETSAPSGYVLDGTAHTVSISYGKVLFDGSKLDLNVVNSKKTPGDPTPSEDDDPPDFYTPAPQDPAMPVSPQTGDDGAGWAAMLLSLSVAAIALLLVKSKASRT